MSSNNGPLISNGNAPQSNGTEGVSNPSAGTFVVVDASSGENRVKQEEPPAPDAPTYNWLAGLACVFCSPMLGSFALNYALAATHENRIGRPEMARTYGRVSLAFSLSAIITTPIIIGVLLYLYFQEDN